jgi:hypothetical protein
VRLLWPKEHGAYGQMLFPLVTSLVIAGPGRIPLLIAAAVLAGFLAHEPFMLLLGFRGVRAKREAGRDAVKGLILFGALLVATGVAAMLLMHGTARASLALPLVPALFLLVEATSGREKGWPAEVAVAVAFSLTAVPICMAGGAPFDVGATIAAAFAVNFTLATLGVRVVILRVRAGGNLRAAAATRTAVFTLAALAGIACVIALATHAAPPLAVAAIVPGAIPGAVVAWQAPPPSQLRRIGWTLVGISTLVALMLIVSFRIA